MRTLNQQEIAAVNGGLSFGQVIDAINGKPATGLFVSSTDKTITAVIAALSPYIKPLIESTINKVAELGFLQKLKPAGGASARPATYEVRRILKAFVDAQWLAEFDARLTTYQSQLAGVTNTKEGTGHE